MSDQKEQTPVLKNKKSDRLPPDISGVEFLVLGNSITAFNISSLRAFASASKADASTIIKAVLAHDFAIMSCFIDTLPYNNEYVERLDSLKLAAVFRDKLKINRDRVIIDTRHVQMYRTSNRRHVETDLSESPGLHVIFGGPESGKSQYIESLFGGSDGRVIRFGEPREHYDDAANAVHAQTMTQALLLALLYALRGFPVAIDSLREAIFGSSSGAAGPGGVSVTVYGFIANLSSLFSGLGVSVMAVVNPMVVGDNYVTVRSGLVSSATSLTHLDRSSVVYYSGRTSEGRVVKEGTDAASLLSQGRKADMATNDDAVGPIKPVTTNLERADLVGPAPHYAQMPAPASSTATSSREHDLDDDSNPPERHAAVLDIKLN